MLMSRALNVQLRYHPNPQFRAIEKQLDKLKKQRARLLAELGETVAGSTPEQAPDRLLEFGNSAAAADLAELNEAVQDCTELLAPLPVRENARDAGYKCLQIGSRVLHNTIAATAWWLETKLADMIAPHYARAADEARSLVAAALQTSGSLRLEPGQLVIQLCPQSEPCRTRAVNALARQVTNLRRTFPGSARRIVFEPTPCPPAPAARQAQ